MTLPAQPPAMQTQSCSRAFDWRQPVATNCDKQLWQISSHSQRGLFLLLCFNFTPTVCPPQVVSNERCVKDIRRPPRILLMNYSKFKMRKYSRIINLSTKYRWTKYRWKVCFVSTTWLVYLKAKNVKLTSELGKCKPCHSLQNWRAFK